DGADERVLAVQHDAGDRPVHPAAVWSLDDDGAPGVEVAAAVAVVDIGGGEPVEIDRVAEKPVFLARPRGDATWRDRRPGMSARQGFDDVLSRCGCRQSKRKGDADQAVLLADAGRSAEDAEARLDALDAIEQRRRRLQLIGAADDRPHLEVP